MVYGCDVTDHPPQHAVEISAGHWIFTDTHSTCGNVSHDNEGLWEAYAFEEMSLTHYYHTEQEARSFIAGWCKP
jgi:hypothetical protein